MPELSPADIWARCLQSIRSKVQEQSFRTWFEATGCRHICAQKAIIDVPSSFFAEWLEEHYAWLIQASFEEVTKTRPALEFRIRGDQEAENRTGPVPFSGTKPSSPEPPARPPTKTVPSLNPRYCFDRFVVGQSNELPFSAARAVAESPGQEFYNPLVLYGGVGLGKTHLLQSIGELAQKNPNVNRVVYATAETFFSDYIRGIRDRDTSAFVAHYRTADILLLDDIQFYVLTEGSQRELLHTFNALYQQNKQIVLTSDCPPSALKGFVDRLVSRFQSGLVAEVGPPDLETRKAVILQKASEMALELCDETASLIAGEVDANIRELEGALNRLAAVSNLTHQPVTPALARQTLQSGVRLRPSQPLSMDTILQATADYFNVPIEHLKGPSRRQPVTRARHVCMYLCKSFTNAPLKAIGKSFGGRDHSTVIHACRSVEQRAADDSGFQDELGELRKRIKRLA